MSEFFKRQTEAIARHLRGPFCSSILRQIGVDPKRYWLLMDLFRKLSTRQEMQGQMGRQTHALRVGAVWCLGISALIAAGFVFLDGSAFLEAAVTLGFTAFLLVTVLLSEAANSLVNPDEALALAHQPINGATYTAAKLSHLLNIVLHYSLGWNLLPALVTPFLRDGRWFYPILYVAAALGLGVLLAMFCCSIYGLLMRVVPARRIKSASQFVQAIPAVLIMFLQFSPQGTVRRLATAIVSASEPVARIPIWITVPITAGFAIAMVAAGLRTLSGDYLIRVSSMVHGKSDAGTRLHRSLLGGIVRRFFGGQGGRAGFDYMKRMLLRDWQFRRQLLSLLPMMFFMVVGLFGAGISSPFLPDFTVAHFVPHVLGFILFSSSLAMPYGTDYRGVWLFLLAADRALARFAQGVHACLWLGGIIVPNLLLFVLFAWKWGVMEAAVFGVYSVCVSSVYLAFSLRGIDGIPFGKQVGGAQLQGNVGFIRMMGLIVAGLIGVGVQYLLYRSFLAVCIATPAIAAGAFVLTRRSVNNLHRAMVFQLSIVSRTSTMIYKEVGSGE